MNRGEPEAMPPTPRPRIMSHPVSENESSAPSSVVSATEIVVSALQSEMGIRELLVQQSSEFPIRDGGPFSSANTASVNAVPSSFLPESPSEIAEFAPSFSETLSSGVLPPGITLGHFQVMNLIGGGGMGRVYLATDTALERLVAIKVLRRKLAHDHGIVARFMNEAKSAARLNHEHIAQVYFCGEQEGVPFIVFEYVEGTNIRSIIDEEGPISLPQALNYLIQITSALTHAAEHGVIHRDVKPSNILITKENCAKLIDMGLARLLVPSEAKNDLTASGVTLGTFDYISPEQARDPRSADIRSDIYSLGCTFFYMLAGRPPFPEGTVLQKLLQHQGDLPPDIRTFRPNIPTEVAYLLQKMMAKDPRQRFQTPSALHESLVLIAETIGMRPTGPRRLSWETGTVPKRRQWIRLLPGLLAVLGFVLTLGLLILFSRQSPPFPMPDVTHSPLLSPWAADPNGSSGATTDQPVVGIPSEYPQTPKTSSKSALFVTDVDEGLARQTTVWKQLGFSRDASTLVMPAVERNMIAVGLSASVSETEVSLASKTANLTSTLSPPSAPLGSGRGTTISSGLSSRFLVVDPSGVTLHSFLTLSAAVAEAEEGATIELKWDGPITLEPLVFHDRRLTFVAAKGFWPELSFSPSEPSNMLTMTDSDLTFQDVTIEMRIPREILASRWTLFELLGNNRLSFLKTTLTIQNTSDNYSAYHQDVAFFRNGFPQAHFSAVSSDSVAELGAAWIGWGWETPTDTTEHLSHDADKTERKTDTSAARSELQLSFDGCLIRGEAIGFRVEVPQTVRLAAERSVIAITNPFLQTEDTKRQRTSDIRMKLDDVLFYGNDVFCRINRASLATEPMRLTVNSARSSFLLRRTPLFEFHGAKSLSNVDEYFIWNGHDSNIYRSLSVVGRCRAIAGVAETGINRDITIDEWNESSGKSTILNAGEETLAIRKPFCKIAREDVRAFP